MSQLAWTLDPTTGGIAVGDTGWVDRPIAVRALSGGLVQLGWWRMRYGGQLSDEPDTELGAVAGWQDPALDETGWMGAQRVNVISGCFPTWEADSYTGYAWYRTSFELPVDVRAAGQLRLGAPAEARSLRWRAWLDGQLITPEPVPTGVLDMPVALSPGEHTLTVQLRIAPPAHAEAATTGGAAELEGWRRVDSLCHGEIVWDETPAAVLDQPDGPDALTDASGRWRVQMRYTDEPGAGNGQVKITRSATLTHRGPDPVILDEITVGGRVGVAPSEVHPEGAWAGFADGWSVAAADPAAITVAADDGARALCWPGVTLAAGQGWDLPDLIGDRHPDDWRLAVQERLAGLGPRRGPLAIYDPYGWYQISHASEPKVELDVDLVARMDPVIGALRQQGWPFTHLALDCGWNDPDDLSRFHPGNFPDGPGPVRRLVDDHGLGLILWVSPSDGARAFRGELGMENPGFDASRIPHAGPRLCPAAEPWRTAFSDALWHLAESEGATGFKIDGTELCCNSTEHGHLPGIWSMYATTRALIAVFERLRTRPDMTIMLYWGLRSPWWLRWADTVWEGAYLVEAAAPSGRPAWTLRSSVACCQDHGRRAAYPEIPPQRQDSLGVWLSEATWASRQGSAGWDDALVLDVARSGGWVQPWGDLRPMAAAPERTHELADLFGGLASVFEGTMTPLGDPISETEAYGYAWTKDETTWVVLSQPGPGGVTYLPPSVHGEPTLDYLSLDAASEAGRDEHGAWITQSAGSVVAYLFTGDDVAPRRAAEPHAAGVVTLGAVQVEVTGRPADDDLVRLWAGRVPSIAGWGTGATRFPDYDDALAIRVPPLDRRITGRRLVADARAELRRAGRLAVIVRWRRGDVAWHNDLLHEVTRLALCVDGVFVQPTGFPDFRHDQAGSWSWMRYEVGVEAGAHEVAIDLTTCAPDNVTVDLDVWVR